MASLGQLKLRAIALLVGMFLAGGLAGVGLGRQFRPHRVHNPEPPPYDQLGLSPAQEVRAREIFERHRAELDAIVQQTMPRVEAVQEAIDQEMRATLTPDQIRTLDRLRANRPPRPPGLPGLIPPPRGGPPPDGPPRDGPRPPGAPEPGK